MAAFFFDTADTDYIRKVWDKLGKHIDPSAVIGITTNPNALAKNQNYGTYISTSQVYRMQIPSSKH